MRSKLLGGAAALALTAGVVLATAGPAAAAPWHHGWGWGPGAIAGSIIGGALAAATSPLWAPRYYDYYPGAYTPAYTYNYVAPGGGNVAWCEGHFHSYNPATGMYLGYDGQYHRCP